MTDATKQWSYNTGERGRNWVRAYEERKTGILYLDWLEGPDDDRRRRRRSLGHRDRETAKAEADAKAAELATAEPTNSVPETRTLGELFDNYLETETPHKGESKRGHDRRAARMFLDLYGRDRVAMTLTLGDWKQFIRGRRDGSVRPLKDDGSQRALTSRQRERRERDEPVVRARVIAYDLKLLWAVLNWAASTADKKGELLLPRNPLRAYVKSRDWPREKNPSQPVLTDTQYEAMLERAGAVSWRFELALVLAHETGHRIGSIRQLRWADVDLEAGWITWPAATDKNRRRHRTPLTGKAARALRRARGPSQREGHADWVLPSPEHPTRPCSRHRVRDWWDDAQARLEERGVLERDVDQMGWHALRRKFASDLRDLPLKDLADLGGWRQTRTITECYLTRDEERMVAALESRGGSGG